MKGTSSTKAPQGPLNVPRAPSMRRLDVVPVPALRRDERCKQMLQERRHAYRRQVRRHAVMLHPNNTTSKSDISSTSKYNLLTSTQQRRQRALQHIAVFLGGARGICPVEWGTLMAWRTDAAEVCLLVAVCPRGQVLPHPGIRRAPALPHALPSFSSLRPRMLLNSLDLRAAPSLSLSLPAMALLGSHRGSHTVTGRNIVTGAVTQEQKVTVQSKRPSQSDHTHASLTSLSVL